MTCQHSESAPVEVRVDHIALQLGDQSAVQVVARICTNCHAQLPANWGCEDCVWVEVRQLCDLVPTVVLGQPCPAHSTEGA